MSKQKKRKPVVKETPSKKGLAIAARPSSRRVASFVQNPDAHLDKRIGWRFSRMDDGGKGECSLKLLHEYAEEMKGYEKFTRKQIDGRPHCHPCATSKLSQVGKARVNVLQLEEGTLYQLGFGDACRLWGVWDGNIFEVIWLDEKHAFYTAGQSK